MPYPLTIYALFSNGHIKMTNFRSFSQVYIIRFTLCDSYMIISNFFVKQLKQNTEVVSEYKTIASDKWGYPP